MARLKEIEICAFMSFDHVVLSPPQGLVLIEGIVKDAVGTDSNGAGKTSLFDAITWCAFAKTMRGLKGDEIINEFLEQGYTFVKETWELDDEEELIIERYRKHSEYKDDLRVTYSGTDISGPTAQEAIEGLLGISFNVFTHSIMFGQEIAKFGSLGDVDRKKLLDEILDLEVLERAQRVAKLEIKDLEDKVLARTALWHIKNTELETKQKDLVDYEQRNTEYKKVHAEELADLKLRLKDARVDQRELGDSLKASCGELDVDNKALKKLSEQLILIDKKEKEIDSKEGKDKDSKEKILTVAHNEVFRIQKEITAVKNLDIGVKCPTCRQPITSEHRISVLKELAIRQAKAIKSEEEAKKVYDAAVITFGAAKLKVEMEKDKLTMRKTLCTQDKDKVNKEIGRLSILVGAKDNEVTALSSRVENKGLEKNPYRDLIKKVNNELLVLDKDLDILGEEIAGVNSQISVLEFWKWGFGPAGLKSHILESITPMLNEIADKFSAGLTGGDIRIQFQTREQLKSRDDFAEKFGFSVTLPKGGSSYKHCSAGEKRRIDLIIMFSLQSLLEAVTGFTSNIVFYDEVFDHLDATGREFVLELLAEEATKRETVFVITQETALRDYFQSVITVEKEGGISTINA